MSMTVSEAAAEAGKWGNLIRALGKLSEVAQFLATQQSAVDQQERRLAELTAAGDDAATRLATANAAADALEAKSKSILETASKTAQGIVDEARVQAKEIVVEANKVRGDAEEAIGKLKAEFNDLKAKRDSARTEIEGFAEKLKQAKAAARAQLGD